MSINSYPKIYAMGHRAIADLLLDPVYVSEKVDGSQFSFGIIDDELQCRSKGQQLLMDNPEKLFAEGVEYVKSIAHLLNPGWVYRGEYLKTPRHNTMKYDRIPKNHIIIFDINTGLEDYMPIHRMAEEADKIGLEVVPIFYGGRLESKGQLEQLMDTESVLGGEKIEGVVIKNYYRFGIDKKVLMGKYVREGFKERNGASFRAANPKQGDMIQQFIDAYRNEARMNKAIQRLRDSGELEDSLRDIPKLMKALAIDLNEECADEIKEALWKWAWPKIQRGVTAGIPDFYKKHLLDMQFGTTE